MFIRKSPELQRLIAKAKSLLMRRHGWPEPQAHREIQRYCMNNRANMEDVAKAIIQGKKII